MGQKRLFSRSDCDLRGSCYNLVRHEHHENDYSTHSSELPGNKYMWQICNPHCTLGPAASTTWRYHRPRHPDPGRLSEILHGRHAAASPDDPAALYLLLLGLRRSWITVAPANTEYSVSLISFLWGLLSRTLQRQCFLNPLHLPTPLHSQV